MSHFNSGAIVYDPLVVYVPDTIVGTCRAIQNRKKGLEFSILCKGGFEQDGFVIQEGYVVPKQEITGTSVDFTDTAELEKYLTDGYNTIIHSHPFKSETFSSSDRETLSTNYQCSLLYSDDKIVTATVSIRLGESLLVIAPEVKPMGMFLSLPKNFDDLVKEKKFAACANQYHRVCGEFDVYGNRITGFKELPQQNKKWRNVVEISKEVIPSLQKLVEES